MALYSQRFFLKAKYKDDNIHEGQNKVIENKPGRRKDGRMDIISYRVPSVLKIHMTLERSD